MKSLFLGLILQSLFSSLFAQEEIMDILFTDPVRGNKFYYNEITSIAEVDSLYGILFPFSADELIGSYDDVETTNNEFLADSLMSITFSLNGKESRAFNYFQKGRKSFTAFLIIPGSGHNQSTTVYNYEPGYHNFHFPISEYLQLYGDVYTYIKPNEDILALRHEDHKINSFGIYPHLINKGTQYSANYLIQAISTVKELKSQYDNVVVMGVSQGGSAALIVSLITEPLASIIASGYSILLDDAYFAGENQVVFEGYFDHFNKDSVKHKIGNMSTEYLFSWGKEEDPYYNYENKSLLTYNFLEETGRVTYAVNHLGHAFPTQLMMDNFFINQFLRPAPKLEDLEGLGQSGVFPNPANNSFYIRFKESLEREVKVFDVQGMPIEIFATSDTIFSIDLKERKQGIYFIKTREVSTGEIQSFKIYKEN